MLSNVRKRIGRFSTYRRHVRCLQANKQRRKPVLLIKRYPPNFIFFRCIRTQFPNINAVSTKSSPRTARDEWTTVRVVARLIPADVGMASAVKQRNPRHRDSEHHALNQTVDEIRRQSTAFCIADQKNPLSMLFQLTPTSDRPRSRRRR